MLDRFSWYFPKSTCCFRNSFLTGCVGLSGDFIWQFSDITSACAIWLNQIITLLPSRCILKKKKRKKEKDYSQASANPASAFSLQIAEDIILQWQYTQVTKQKSVYIHNLSAAHFSERTEWRTSVPSFATSLKRLLSLKGHRGDHDTKASFI